MKLLYTEEELPQRSPEWHEIRKRTIGASETGVILGLLTKYERPITAWKRRTGRLKPKPENDAMARGEEMEAEAREAVKAYLEKEEGIKQPEVIPYFGLHPDYSFISASFDGVDINNKFVTELKCPKYVSVFKSVFENGIQDYYYCQVQQQLLIANYHWGIEKGYFCSYYPFGAYIFSPLEYKEYFKKIVVIDAELDWNYCNAMLTVLEKFNGNVQEDKWDQDEYQEVLKTFNDTVCKQNLK